jgi:uncharacterized protein YecT (DUF1311 family)
MTPDQKAWIHFRDCVCPCHKSSHGPAADTCNEVDEKGHVIAYHGDCVMENCPARWREDVKE